MRLYEFDTLEEVEVLSSWIADLAYRDGNTIMMLNNGRKYIVRDVPYPLHKQWLRVRSKGKFWHRRIAKKFHVSRNI